MSLTPPGSSPAPTSRPPMSFMQPQRVPLGVSPMTSTLQFNRPAISGAIPATAPPLGGLKTAKKRQNNAPLPPQYASTAVKTSEAVPAPKRRKKRFSEARDLPDQVKAVVPDSIIYCQLLEIEKRMDATLARKKQDIQEALKCPARHPRKLRIRITNTHTNQDGPPGTAPSWCLQIRGQIVEDSADPAKGARDTTLSTYVKRLTVELDPLQYQDNIVTWEPEKGSGSEHGFEVRRTGSTDFTAKVTMEMNYVPQRFQLSSDLAAILGIKLETRARIIAGIWQYVKANKLQNAQDPSTIDCSAPLQQLFGEAKVKLSSVSSRLHQHLSIPPPIQMEHLVQLTGDPEQSQSFYDLSVDVPPVLLKEMSDYLLSLEKHREIEALDAQILEDIRKLNEHRTKRAFYSGFSESPVDFIQKLVASQQRDLRQAMAGNGRKSTMERSSDFYKQPWVEDAVLRYLNRRPAPTD